jgi:large subunit ribosomal protein L31
MAKTTEKVSKKPAEKAGAGPNPYFSQAKITCACGAVHMVGSTREEMFVEICSKCHPLYTGVRKLIDEGGRVGRFEKRTATSKERTATQGGKKARVAKRATIKATKQPKVEKE